MGDLVGEDAQCLNAQCDSEGDDMVSLMQMGHKVARNLQQPPPVHLPDHLRTLGRKLFGSDKAVDELVAKSMSVNVTWAGKDLVLHMNGGDDAKDRLGVEGNKDGYGLGTLAKVRKEGGMINMVDIGGNYGVVTIAAFKHNPKLLRALVVEPIPVTYFFLRWNLWQNGVPELTESTMLSSKHEPGVVAMQAGISKTDGTDLNICWDPSKSMNAGSTHDQSLLQSKIKNCMNVHGLTMERAMGMFGEGDTVTMMKIDCEGCESIGLPALMKLSAASTLKRLAGELHCPNPEEEKIACRYEAGVHMIRICGTEAIDMGDRCKVL